MKRAIKNHLSDFLAIIGLLVISVVVAGYILHNERLRFPFLQSTPITMYADFQDAKAVTAGQGQSVRVSGVQIGLISGVSEKDGYARVAMAIDPQYRNLIHTNWTALLRPRTGLDDMFVELQPGPGHGAVAKPGFTIPLGQTAPEVHVYEILSELDSDTRNYLDLLVNGAGDGLKDNGGSELAQVFRRFEPTDSDLARLNGAVAQRGADLQQLVNSLARLNSALAQKQNQLVSLVQASDRVFTAFADQNRNVSQAISELPATLRQTSTTLADVQSFAQQLGPAASSLLPAARALPAANIALRQLAVPSTPILRNQIRPFVVAARPLVRNLRPAAVNLAAATPNLAKTFTVIEHLVNMLGFNPGGSQHGYLWWLAWVDHDARSVFSNQDANGDFRNLFLQASCATLAQLADSVTGSEALLNLTPILTDAGLCPKQAAADVAAYRAYRQGKLSPRRAVDGKVTSGVKVPFLPKLPAN